MKDLDNHLECLECLEWLDRTLVKSDTNSLVSQQEFAVRGVHTNNHHSFINRRSIINAKYTYRNGATGTLATHKIGNNKSKQGSSPRHGSLSQLAARPLTEVSRRSTERQTTAAN